MAVASGRFMRRGFTKFRWVTTLTTPSSPTATQINAGIDLTPQAAEVAGFEFSSNPIPSPDFANAFTPQIAGEDTASESSITFYEVGSAADTIRTSQVKGATGYVVIAPAGTAGATFAAADNVEVWPCTIGSRARQYTADNEGAKYRVVYNVTAAPSIDVAVT